MRIELNITDRELLDLDLAVTERKIKLGIQLKQININQRELLKKGDLVAFKTFESENRQIQDEINSLNTIIDKLYESTNNVRKALDSD